MPLNYSKWDNLELSDDSDIEGHPNVDHRSLVRWKQRAIHEQREERKLRIAQLKADIGVNEVLRPRLAAIAQDVDSQGPPHFSSLVERFKTNPAPDKPPTNAPDQKTYDEMLLALMLQVWEEAKKKGVEKDDPKLGQALVEGLKTHLVRIDEHQEKLRKELAKEEAEMHKKITSEDIHEGFDSKYVPPKPAPPPVKNAIQDKPKKTVTEFETLNPRGVASAPSTSSSEASSSKAPARDDDPEADELPELTPSLEGFSRIPVRAYEQSWEFIKAHRDVYVPGASDALLVAAFRAQSDGNAKGALQCVHQSLLLQYCEKLGKDGPSMFFRKMTSGDPRATAVFEKDVQDTYAHLVERVRISKAEEAAASGEQIQLVPENPDTQIGFNVPDGPPPEHLELEGPGFENVSVEDVRKALQMQWDVFSAFDERLQKALRSQSLDEVNKVLGSMKVEDAEEVVRLLDVSGILNFSESGVRDETGRGEADEGGSTEEDGEGDEGGVEEEDGNSKVSEVD
ncbi:Cdc37 N terminal kinase binding-domain-containing protein [Dichomitus squalens]|uniref:Hsp90 chaperone protein kinase-targeting subunit n=1 Tax=Dichomitus squalens TaxID=114155 RepID=A0A4V2K8Z5_9APHY|nr:Cdc37 N terminal kinase binding-domain-containing protein [Dichomitus squalens]